MNSTINLPSISEIRGLLNKAEEQVRGVRNFHAVGQSASDTVVTCFKRNICCLPQNKSLIDLNTAYNKAMKARKMVTDTNFCQIVINELQVMKSSRRISSDHLTSLVEVIREYREYLNKLLEQQILIQCQFMANALEDPAVKSATPKQNIERFSTFMEKDLKQRAQSMRTDYHTFFNGLKNTEERLTVISSQIKNIEVVRLRVKQAKQKRIDAFNKRLRLAQASGVENKGATSSSSVEKSQSSKKRRATFADTHGRPLSISKHFYKSKPLNTPDEVNHEAVRRAAESLTMLKHLER
ncbi:MAG: hypothetical protein S4CHLAM20_07180 [Chlamydiia bacterium]|nr:hypothetical protein [Chlamydiia bacterium]